MAGKLKKDMKPADDEEKKPGEEKKDDEDGDEDAKKSLDANDLEKALDLLDEVTRTPADEKKVLLEKALAGRISADENARLLDLMGGGRGEEKPDLSKSVTDALRGDDDRLQKSIDVSPFLSGLFEGLEKALGELGSEVQKSGNRQHDFNVLFARTLRAVGMLAKSMDERLATIEEQPAGAPKGALSKAQLAEQKTRAMQKSFAGDGEERLSKSQVKAALQSMELESFEKGRGGKAPCGEDLLMAIAKYESTQRVSRPLLNDIIAHTQGKAA